MRLRCTRTYGAYKECTNTYVDEFNYEQNINTMAPTMNQLTMNNGDIYSQDYESPMNATLAANSAWTNVKRMLVYAGSRIGIFILDVLSTSIQKDKPTKNSK